MSIYTPGNNDVKHFATATIAQWIKANGGFDAQSRKNTPNADKLGGNGSFSRSDGATIAMWITSINADFSINGESGQSRMVREFFPRSFNDVTLTIAGNVASTQEYNRLALFIRESHWNALNRHAPDKGADPTVTFTLGVGTNPHAQFTGRNVKGPHRPWQVSGYIHSVKAGALHHEVAPEFSIEFIVATSTLSANTGIWGDVKADSPSLKNILEMVPDRKLVNKSKYVHGQGNTVGRAVAAESWSLQVADAMSSLGIL